MATLMHPEETAGRLGMEAGQIQLGEPEEFEMTQLSEVVGG